MRSRIVADGYRARASALEDEVGFYRVVNGRREQLKGADLPVGSQGSRTSITAKRRVAIEAIYGVGKIMQFVSKASAERRFLKHNGIVKAAARIGRRRARPNGSRTPCGVAPLLQWSHREN